MHPKCSTQMERITVKSSEHCRIMLQNNYVNVQFNLR